MSKNGWQEMNLLIRYRSEVENENLNPDSVGGYKSSIIFVDFLFI